MLRNVLRLGIATLLLAGAPVLGLALFYLLESPAYSKVAPIDFRLAPAEVLKPLDGKRTLLRSIVLPAPPASESGAAGQLESSRQRIIRQDGIVGARLASVLHQEYVGGRSSAFASVTLRKYYDPISSRLALFELAGNFFFPDASFNPIQGYSYLHTGPVEIYSWVDNGWLVTIVAANHNAMVELIYDFPYLRAREDPAPLLMLDGARPEKKFALPAVLLLAAIIVWPAVTSRALALRPDRASPPLPAEELESRLLSLNGDSRHWRVTRLNDDEFAAEWKLDDMTWQGLFGRFGLARAQALRLRLDRRRTTVKAAGRRYIVRAKGKWSAGGEVVIGSRPSVGLDLADWRPSSVNGKSAERTVDPVLEAGLGYDISEIKREVVGTVLSAGWSYQPALLMRWS